MYIFEFFKPYFKPYKKIEVALKIASAIIGLAYVIYVYGFGDGLGNMVPRYAGY